MTHDRKFLPDTIAIFLVGDELPGVALVGADDGDAVLSSAVDVEVLAVTGVLELPSVIDTDSLPLNNG